MEDSKLTIEEIDFLMKRLKGSIDNATETLNIPKDEFIKKIQEDLTDFNERTPFDINIAHLSKALIHKYETQMKDITQIRKAMSAIYTKLSMQRFELLQK